MAFKTDTKSSTRTPQVSGLGGAFLMGATMIKITYGPGKPITSYAQAYQTARQLLTDNPHNWVRMISDVSDYSRVMHTHPDLTIHTFSDGRNVDVDADIRALESPDNNHPMLPQDREG